MRLRGEVFVLNGFLQEYSGKTVKANVWKSGSHPKGRLF